MFRLTWLPFSLSYTLQEPAISTSQSCRRREQKEGGAPVTTAVPSAHAYGAPARCPAGVSGSAPLCSVASVPRGRSPSPAECSLSCSLSIGASAWASLARLPSYLFTMFHYINNIWIPFGCKIKIKHKNKAKVCLDHMLHLPHTHHRIPLRRGNQPFLALLTHLDSYMKIQGKKWFCSIILLCMYIWCSVNCFLLPLIFLPLSECTNWPHSSKLLPSEWLWGQQYLFNPSLTSISAVSGFCRQRPPSHEHPMNSGLCLPGGLLWSRQHERDLNARYVLNFNMHQQTVP